jgi:hypothetical protein
MALIEVCVHVAVHRRCTPEVRVVLDLLPGRGGLRTEIELPLKQTRRALFVGAFTVPEQSERSFLYRVGVAAHPGATWTLTFRDRGAGCEVLTDSDLMVTRKAWLTGDCILGRAPSATGVRPRRGPQGRPRRGSPDREPSGTGLRTVDR